MTSKLTLTIDKSIIQQAKKYAKRKENSLSNIIENYLKVLIKENPSSETELTPIVKSLKSSFTSEPDFDYKKELTKRLSDKYL
jgi:hypothetical protein